MPKPDFRVQPQRRAKPSLGWQDCASHQAQRWAVLGSRGQFITATINKVAAEAIAAAEVRNLEGPSRRYALGKRMPINRTDKEA